MATKTDKKKATKIDMLSGLKDMRVTKQNVEDQSPSLSEPKEEKTEVNLQPEIKNNIEKKAEMTSGTNNEETTYKELPTQPVVQEHKTTASEVKAAAKGAMEILELTPRVKKQKKTEHFNFLVTKNRYDQFLALSEQLGTKPNQTFEVILERIFGPDNPA